MAEQMFRSIAAEGKRIPTWDVENILTRAVYRALNNNCQFAQALDHPPVNVDKGIPSTDAQLQLRLVAEKLCKRVERRYEKKLLQQRERDRAETDRKLNDIRNEYSEQMEVRRRDLERERIRLEEEFTEKERRLRHRVELQLAEKESELEITRKSLETRLAELALNKEHLDRIKSEFQAKYATDIEMLNREWERLSRKKEELRTDFQREFEGEQQLLKEKCQEVEKENLAFKMKLSDNGTELFEMRSKLSRLATLEEDLQAAEERLRKEVEQNRRLSRYKYDSERLKEENVLMKEEIEQLKALSREQKTSILLRDSSKTSGEVYEMKINELKAIIRMMSDKITSLSSERDYLREMLRCARKDIFRDSVTKGRAHTNVKAICTSLSSRKHLADTDSSEDISVSSSALSECASDLRLIKERFATLENIAKTLDTTVNSVAAARSLTSDQLAISSELSASENYDDFCRCLKIGSNLYSSPMKRGNNKELPKNQGLDQLSSQMSIDQNIMDDETPRLPVLSCSAQPSTSAAEGPSVKVEVDEEATTAVRPVASTEEAPATGMSFTEEPTARREASRKLKFSAPSEEEIQEGCGYRQPINSPESIGKTVEKYMTLVVNRAEVTGQESSSAVQFEEDEIHIDKPGDSDDEIEW